MLFSAPFMVAFSVRRTEKSRIVFYSSNFSFPSQYYCAIGLWECLGLGLDASRIPAPNPRSRTLDTRHYPFQLPVPGCHRVTQRFPAHFPSLDEDRHGSEHHIRTPSLGAFSLPCALFNRLYWGHRSFFLFLRLIRCFNSPRSPSKSGLTLIWN